jgi:dual specificity tyrosine-phosphorylation-regulated kinase 2/3/4
MWSLGCVVVELLTGIPHWLCYKCRVTFAARDVVKSGLFAVKG